MPSKKYRGKYKHKKRKEEYDKCRCGATKLKSSKRCRTCFCKPARYQNVSQLIKKSIIKEQNEQERKGGAK